MWNLRPLLPSSFLSFPGPDLTPTSLVPAGGRGSRPGGDCSRGWLSAQPRMWEQRTLPPRLREEGGDAASPLPRFPTSPQAGAALGRALEEQPHRDPLLPLLGSFFLPPASCPPPPHLSPLQSPHSPTPLPFPSLLVSPPFHLLSSSSSFSFAPWS